jgi:hypothetical protein
MNSWLAWGVFAVAVVSLGWVGYHFTVRTLRLVTLALALVVAVVVTGYGVTHPPQAPIDLVNGFIRGVDYLSVVFFQPLLPGHKVPAPGRFGWLVILALFVFAYRQLEAWAMRWQPPVVDISALDGGPGVQKGSLPGAPGGGASGGKGNYDELVAELRFRLPAVEVRAPSILPGGTMPNGLASIAENSDMTGGGLAGAIIRVAGLLWPTPRRYKVRVWVKPVDSSVDANSGGGTGQEPGRAGERSARGEGHAVASMTVTVDIEDAQTGGSIATKTLAARHVDDAAARVAAYVARQIFRQDPTVPPWSVGSFDGSDLAALLCAKQEQRLIDCPEDAHNARCRQIEELKNAVANSPGAGVARYELALLYDLEGCHLEALRMHALNRRQYPRFFRGRYRLGMSLEMIANPEFPPWGKEDAAKLSESLEILDRCRITSDATDMYDGSAGSLSCELRKELLEAATQELRECQRQLTLWRLIWATFWHRDERAIRKPYWRLRERQRFQDGCRVAELLVAVRQRLNEQECSDPGKDGSQASKEHYDPKRAMHIIASFAGDITAIQTLLTTGGAEIHPPRWSLWRRRTSTRRPGEKWHPEPKAEKTRWLPWQHRTPSWGAAYNAACLYTALAYDGRYRQKEKGLKGSEDSIALAVDSLKRVVNDRLCEMERPSDWISKDPDLHFLYRSSDFRKFIRNQIRNDYPKANIGPIVTGTGWPPMQLLRTAPSSATRPVLELTHDEAAVAASDRISQTAG